MLTSTSHSAQVPDFPQSRPPASSSSGGMWSAAQERRGNGSGDLRSRHSSVASPLDEGQPQQRMGSGSSVPDLDVLMTDLRSITSSYEEVHKKLDSLEV